MVAVGPNARLHHAIERGTGLLSVLTSRVLTSRVLTLLAAPSVNWTASHWREFNRIQASTANRLRRGLLIRAFRAAREDEINAIQLGTSSISIASSEQKHS
jgi:hypothetical protein